MNEIITTGGVSYAVKNVTTGINTISFMIIGENAGDVEALFRDVSALTVGDGESVYGEYPDVRFESLTIGADRSVTVTMHILNEMEKQMKELQISQGEQDEAIAELYGGGEA